MKNVFTESATELFSLKVALSTCLSGSGVVGSKALFYLIRMVYYLVPFVIILVDPRYQLYY